MTNSDPLETAGRKLSCLIAGCGYGANREHRDQFKSETEAAADKLERDGMEAMGKVYGAGPTRVQFENKDPRGYAEFMEQLCSHSATGSANTLRGVQAVRPSSPDSRAETEAVTLPKSSRVETCTV